MEFIDSIGVSFYLSYASAVNGAFGELHDALGVED